MEVCDVNGIISTDSPAAGAEPVLLDYRQAAKVLSIGERTLSDLVKHGEIPVVRIRSRVLFRPAALADWAKAHETLMTGTSPDRILESAT